MGDEMASGSCASLLCLSIGGSTSVGTLACESYKRPMHAVHVELSIFLFSSLRDRVHLSDFSRVRIKLLKADGCEPVALPCVVSLVFLLFFLWPTCPSSLMSPTGNRPGGMGSQFCVRYVLSAVFSFESV